MEKVKRDWCREAIALLRAGLDLGPEHDMRTGRVYAALDYLETKLGSIWSIVTFRRAMEIGNAHTRWHRAAAALSNLSEVVAARQRRAANIA